MSVVHITVIGSDAQVRAPFEAKDLIKVMPKRRWDKPSKVWIIPAINVDELTEILEAEGFKVIITRKTKQRSQPTSPSEPSASWADQMFTALGPALGEKAFKALTRVFHPDAGGSTEIMQQLNVARDRQIHNR